MRKFGAYWLCVTMIFFLQKIVAQNPCWSDQVCLENARRFPNLSGQKAKKLPQGAISRNTGVIPVVVHVVYKSTLENISDDQINSQIAVLNADYQLLNADANLVPLAFSALSADMSLEFCLAQTDPDGLPTTGITRTATPFNQIGQLYGPDGRPRIYYSDLGGENAWDTERYLNIWIGTIGGGIFGFATYPGTTIPEEDGVVIDPRYFGTTGWAAMHAPHHLGRTATHEIGHFFNLKHLWGSELDDCTEDDGVDDTPIQRFPSIGCPIFPQVSCGFSSMFMNFMDYSDDPCLNFFTEGQKNRVWQAIGDYRGNLLTSNACTVAEHQQAEQNNRVVVYPNPAAETVFLKLPETDASQSFELAVFDELGRKICVKFFLNPTKKASINIQNWPPGRYYLKIISLKGTYSGIISKI